MLSVGGNRMKADVVREVAALRQNEFFKTAAVLRTQANSLIMEAAAQNKKSAAIEIPEAFSGREPYDPIEMGKTLVTQLREDGYRVSGTYLKFSVFWDQQQQRKEESPIVRVPKPMAKKK